MKRVIIKILSFLILIALFISPIIQANTTTKKEIFEETILEIQTIDPKIQDIIEKINETLIREFMEYLVFEVGSRYTGTYGCKKAAIYIYEKFENMGLQTRYHDWSAWGNRWHRGFFRSQNVIGTHPGTDPDYDEIIIFNAHYDTVKGTVGAVDDGSGTVGVLAAAYVLSQYDFKRTIKFITFSGEENGLLGSRAYAKELYEKQTPVLVEINAEMIGKATSAETGRKIRLSVTEDAGWMADVMEDMTNDYGFNFNITSWDMDRNAKYGGSDYFEFIKLGYESVAVWPGEWDPYMHTPQDNISNVNFSYLVNTTRHIAATMAILADMDVEQPRIYIANPRFGKIFYNDIPKRTYRYKTPSIIDKTIIYAEVRQGMYPIEKVEFYYNDRLIFTDNEKPYEYMLNERAVGLRNIKVVVYDTQGNTATDEMRIMFLNMFKNR